MKEIAALACFVLLAGGCSRGAGPDAGGAVSAGLPLGEVMVGVGRRFETAGRAALANRFELAEFEVGEIQETFEGEVPHAALPKEGPTAHIAAQAADFVRTSVPALKAAAVAKDAVAFASAFQAASAACNACHAASAKAFIQVPFAPGKPVPDTEPVSLQSRPPPQP